LVLVTSPRAADVAVGSKNFPESRLLAEIFAQLIEERTDLTVQRRLGLAGTQVVFEALRTGAIDLYPEYTGTGLVTILGEPPMRDKTQTLNRVREQFLTKWELLWLIPLGFENSYELAVPKDLALGLNLRTISDLAAVAGELRAGLGYEFVEREDGLPGLKRVYGLEFKNVTTMQQALKYQAAGARKIDCLDVYTTDGRLLVHDLVVLEDDRDFFPPYEAAALARVEALDRYPQLGVTLSLLANALDEGTMRGLNMRLQEGGETEAVVARDILVELGLVGPSEQPFEGKRRRDLLGYMLQNRRLLVERVLEHLVLTGLALILGILVAIPLGMYLERRRGIAEWVIRGVAVTQTIPSIALLAFMIPLLGVGARPAVVALWIYSIFPILRNTYTGLRDASPEAVESAGALGMTARQVLLHVRFPLAASIIMAGVRTAAVITVGTATLAAFIGAGGLGVPIVSGLQLNDTNIILSGALPAALLAILVDGGLGLVERWVRPRGLDGRGGR
jgi:osmoprotectant transport system permease protein